MHELIEAQPDSLTIFKQWCSDCIQLLESELESAQDRSLAAALVIRAKTHAYNLTAYDLADVLPARDEKNHVDALLRFRECLQWLDNGGSEQPPAPGVPFTVRQAARSINVNERTVYALCDSGEIAHHRIGNGRGTIRINQDDLSQYLNRNRVHSRPSEVMEDHLFGPA